MITNISTAEHYRWGSVCDGWRLLNRADLKVIQERIPSQAAEVMHFHERARQLFYVLGGQLVIELRGEVFRMSPGDSLEVPPGAAHRVKSFGDIDVSFIVVSAPTTQGDRTNLEPECPT